MTSANLREDPYLVHAYLVGGGIASLAAACHLVQDAKLPGHNIHILEEMYVPGGSMDGAGDAKHGTHQRLHLSPSFRFGTYVFLCRLYLAGRSYAKF